MQHGGQMTKLMMIHSFKEFNILIKENILKIPPTMQDSDIGSSSNDIPGWIKNNAAWWADDQIDDDTFIQGIQFLIKEGILRV